MTTATAPQTRELDVVDTGVLSRYHAGLRSWPTTIEPDTGEVRLSVGHAVDALVMRAGFGGEVNHQLVQAMLRAPIIVVPGSPGTKPDDWIFLTQPRTTMRQSTSADLVSAQVGWYEVGATIPLPAFGSTNGGLRWVQRPKSGVELPGWGAVVGAVRRTFGRTW
ncbi:hypothetical protein [Umezawaea sp. Da 62-37]|uniref:hypothetical protein n=1 Tax=Umezawaea sp. Da 62-37 TaxID=3075927 RepID=UPI0028F7254D|nr:hypothetical protein [Umezawaea sp. Da 62-37]WNV90231.1 hypothetical protein RM788_18645 [Umezawaea sp. Da 62-37]